MSFFPAYICENGHPIELHSHSCPDKYCTICGALIIRECSSCHTAIKGFEIGCSGHYQVPAYCRGCGKALPWTDKAIQATLELLAEDENITTDECNRLSDVIPDILTETPKTQLAAARLKKAIAIVGSITGDALRQFVVDYGCEAVKKLLGL